MKKRKKIFIEVAVFAAVAVVAFLLTKLVVRAGLLNPTAAPASTFKTLQEVFDPIAGSFSTASTTASSTGSVIEQLRCLITRMDGGAC